MFSKSKSSYTPITALAFLLFCFTCMHAQNIRNFPALTGKKDVAANCVLQADNGELWIGTNAGLIQYTGETTKFFTHDDGLVENTVTALFMQSDHTLWIGHKNGKITLLQNKIFKPFFLNGKLPEEPVSAFCEASGIWIASYGAGISYYPPGSKKLQQYNAYNGLSDNSIYTLCTDSTATVWAGTDAGITQIKVKDQKPVFSVISMKEGLPDNIVRSLVYGWKKNLYVGMQDSGVCRYDLTANKFKRICSEWKYGTVTSMLSQDGYDVLIGTQQHGLIRCVPLSIQNPGSLTVTDSRNGLRGNAINSIFIDREENIWLTTDEGVSEIYQNRISVLTTKNGLSSDKIVACFIDSHKNRWISTDKGVMKFAYARNGQTSVRNYFPTEEKPEKQITCIHEDAAGILWFGTYGSGIYRLDPATEKQELISVKNGLANDNISSITGGLHCIWAGTLGGGISCISEANGNRSIKNYSLAQGLTADYIYSVYGDTKNNLWIGSDGEGLIRFTDGKFVNESRRYNLKGKTVYSIKEDGFNNIWFSVAGQGIYRFRNNDMVNYSIANGLRDNSPTTLEVTGTMVITAHPKGIDVLDISTGKFSYFSTSDNDIEPNLNASDHDQQGNAWIGTNTGLIEFRAVDIAADAIMPLVKITSLSVQYQPYPLDSATDFSFRQNNFVFNYTAVWLRSDAKIKFRYKLEGNDSSYFETETKTASYSNLPPGSYTFLVSAANQEGKWSTPLRYSFSIATPPWQRVWFWVALVIIAVSLFYFFVQYRLRVLQKEKNILEHKVNIRTAEIVKQTKVIETKNKELERLSIVARETGNLIIIMDAQGKLEWVNESFERLNSITLEELKKRKCETIFDVSNNPDIRNIIEKCIREKKSVVYESKNTLEDGQIIWESSTLTPIYNERGDLQKLVIIDTDITERKRDEEIIRQKNKDITDSIEYAKKIQNSILPGIDTIKESLPESFVFFLQKDIVSGDFYWFARKNNLAVIAAVDCTGHGVPGAFMSLIGYNLLNQIVNEKNISDPGEILNALNTEVLKALYQNNPDNTSKDGMDISICSIDLQKKEILFAGAMRPLYILNKNGFTEIKGDKIAIGTREDERENGIKFSTHRIQGEAGDVFYICSDGYADQFGGSNGKKMMTKNFKKILSKIYTEPFDQQYALVKSHHEQWKGSFEQVDDILVIGFSI